MTIREQNNVLKNYVQRHQIAFENKLHDPKARNMGDNTDEYPMMPLTGKLLLLIKTMLFPASSSPYQQNAAFQKNLHFCWDIYNDSKWREWKQTSNSRLFVSWALSWRSTVKAWIKINYRERSIFCPLQSSWNFQLLFNISWFQW